MWSLRSLLQGVTNMNDMSAYNSRHLSSFLFRCSEINPSRPILRLCTNEMSFLSCLNPNVFLIVLKYRIFLITTKLMPKTKINFNKVCFSSQYNQVSFYGHLERFCLFSKLLNPSFTLLLLVLLLLLSCIKRKLHTFIL